MVFLQQIKEKIESRATTKAVLIAFILYLASVAVLTFSDGQISRHAPNTTKPDLRYGYTHSEIIDVFTVFGPEGRQAYAANLVIDSVMPVFFAALVLLLVARVVPRWFWLLGIAPVVFLVFDLIENAAFGLMLSQYPEISPALVSVTSIMTRIKLSAFFIAMPTLVLTFLALIINSLFIRRTRRT
jgi:hypothetical protein